MILCNEKSNSCSGCFLWFVVYNIIVFVKYAIYVGPVLVISTVCSTFGALYRTPKCFFKTYYTIFMSEKIGINIKITLTIIAFIPSCTPSIMYLFVAIIFSVIGTLIWTFMDTFDSSLFGTWKDNVIKITWESVCDALDIITKSYYPYLESCLPPNADGHVFDIKIHHILISIVLVLMGMITNAVLSIIFITYKIIPAIFNSWKKITSTFNNCDKHCIYVCCAPYVLTIFFTIPLTILASVLAVVYEIIRSVNIAFVIFTTDSVMNGMMQLLVNIYDMDVFTSEIAYDHYDSSKSPFVVFRNYVVDQRNAEIRLFRNRVRRDRNSRGTTHPITYGTNVPIQQQATQHSSEQRTNNINVQAEKDLKILSVIEIWNSFFRSCNEITNDALVNNFCDKSDIDERDPYLFIGIPSAVIYEAVKRSINVQGIMLFDNIIVNEETMPLDEFSISTYFTINEIKEANRH